MGEKDEVFCPKCGLREHLEDREPGHFFCKACKFLFDISMLEFEPKMPNDWTK